MSWVAAAVTVGTAVYGASQQKKAAKQGANATTQANQLAIDEQRRQFDVSRQDQMPWMQAGQGALSQLGSLSRGDYSGFNQSPDYLWSQQQGVNALDRSAAARGSMFSGGADADRIKFGQGNATQFLGSYRNSLQSLAGLGQSSAQNLGGLGASMASNVGNGMINQGNARASSYQQQADTNSQLAGGLGGMFNNYWQQQKNTGSGNGWGWGGV